MTHRIGNELHPKHGIVHEIKSHCKNNLRTKHAQSYTLFKTLNGHTDWIRSIIKDNTTNNPISASDDNTIKIWNLNTKLCLATLEGHKGWISSIIKDYTTEYLISASNDKTIIIWKPAFNYKEIMNGSLTNIMLILNDLPIEKEI